MSLSVQIVLSQQKVTTLDLPRVSVTLTNGEDQAVLCPVPGDPGNMIFIEAQRSEDGQSRIFDGINQQRMMSGARIDEQTAVAPLDPSDSVTWDLDLCAYDCPLRDGEYRMRGGFLHSDGETTSYSDWHSLTVEPVFLEHVRMHRECPVLDGTTLLLQTGDDPFGFSDIGSNEETSSRNSVRTFVRLHNTKRPLAAWYSKPILRTADSTCFLLSKNYFSSESLDHFFGHWLVEIIDSDNHGAMLAGHNLEWGSPVGKREVPVPAGLETIQSGLVTEDDRLYLFFLDRADERIYCREWTESRLIPVFDINVAGMLEGDVHIFGDCDFIFIALPMEGVHLLRLNYEGKVLNRMSLIETHHPLYSLTVDPVDRILKAAFVDRDDSQEIIFHAIRPTDSTRKSQRIRTEALFTEMGWDYDHKSGQFYCLTHETDASLRYYADNQQPVLIENAPELMEMQHFPVVLAQGGPYLGYFLKKTGMRIGRFTKQHGFDNPHRKL